MEFYLVREKFFDDRTIGKWLDEFNNFKWYTIEDKDRHLEEGETKVYGETAIPIGKYKIEFDWSPKRDGMVPYLRDVPQFEDIQIHIANSPKEILGCIGVGKDYDESSHIITRSTDACKECYKWLLEKIIETKNNCWLNIIRG